jgi:hypothetical protein
MIGLTTLRMNSSEKALLAEVALPRIAGKRG